MEVDEKSKHKCKFCSKIFRCGRSLGGHMRSHLINISSTEKKLPPLAEEQLQESLRAKRYMDDLSPSTEQEDDVALTLILLSLQSHNSTTAPMKKRSKPIHNNNNKFRCMICNKGFPSYQALGGHRASHKKFKGCCAPTTTKLAHNLEDCKKSKPHECPICFKIFPSGQALGGHKRSHTDDLRVQVQVQVEERPIPQLRHFLDLNLPAPLDQDCTDFKPCWIAATRLLSSS